MSSLIVKEPLLEVAIELPGGGLSVLSQHNTIASAFRNLASVVLVGPRQNRIIEVRLTKAGKKHFGVGDGRSTFTINVKESIPYGCVACTCTDFGNPRRRDILVKHKTPETAVRQYRRIWDIYHKLHGHRTWLYIKG